MKIDFPSFTLNAELLQQGNSPEFIFLLHGFTGSLNDWKPVAAELPAKFNVAAIDLIGHGKSDSPDEVSFYTAPSVSFQLFNVIKKFTSEKFILAGYSMGGRAALSFAVNFPLVLKGLILESSAPGIKNSSEKELRIQRDKEIADFISGNSIENFTDYWMNLDIFNTQRRFSKKKWDLIRENKLANNKTGLINSLKGFGTGMMPSYWNSLPEISAKTLLLSGELDSKYTLLLNEMSSLIPGSKHTIIKSAGHNTHLEEPSLFIETVNDFLSAF